MTDPKDYATGRIGAIKAKTRLSNTSEVTMPDIEKRINEIRARVDTTALVMWLENGNGYINCQHGSKDWCDGYLNEAAALLKQSSLDTPHLLAEIDRLTADLAATDAEIDRLRKAIRDIDRHNDDPRLFNGEIHAVVQNIKGAS